MPDPDPCVKSSEMTHRERKLHLIVDSGAVNVMERRQGCEKEKISTALSVVICRSNSVRLDMFWNEHARRCGPAAKTSPPWISEVS